MRAEVRLFLSSLRWIARYVCSEVIHFMAKDWVEFSDAWIGG